MNILDILLIIFFSVFLISSVIFSLFQLILPLLLWGGIYVPSKQETVKRIINLANIQPGEKAADLGSGDGRLVIALAQAGAEVHGYEINLFLVWLAKKNIRKAGFEDKAFIHWKSFWREDLSEFDIVTVYGIGYIMRRLEAKLKNELKAQARVISNSFTFPTWPQSRKENNVFLYEREV